jgi:hypothetical protein
MALIAGIENMCDVCGKGIGYPIGASSALDIPGNGDRRYPFEEIP